MKALSIKQPWAWLIAKGWKDIENRDWSTNYRGRIYIQASMSRRDMNKEVIAAILRRLDNRQAGEFMLAYQNIPKILAFGAIIGEVDIVNCISTQQFEAFKKVSSCYSPWFEGKYGFVLANAVMYDKPIPYRGQLGLFEVEL